MGTRGCLEGLLSGLTYISWPYYVTNTLVGAKESEKREIYDCCPYRAYMSFPAALNKLSLFKGGDTKWELKNIKSICTTSSEST